MLSKEQLDKLTQPDLVKYILNLQDVKGTLEHMDETFTARLQSIEGSLSEFAVFKNSVSEKIERLESQLVVSNNASNLLKTELDQRTEDLLSKIHHLERATYRSAEYLNYETLEIGSIPQNIPNTEVPEVVLKVLNAIDSSGDKPFDLDDVHTIHRRQGTFTEEKVLVKFIRRGDAFFILKIRKN